MIQKLRHLLPQITKFIVVGGINTALDFFVLNLLSYITGIHKGVGVAVLNAISFTVAAINSYFFNKRWTFKDAAKESVETATKKFFSFFVVSIIGLLINSLTVYAITTYFSPFFSITPLLAMLGDKTDILWLNFAKITATGLSLIWNFIGYKFFVFKK